jgi:hypothetical protein
VASYDLKRALRLLDETGDRHFRNDGLCEVAIAACLDDLEQCLQIIHRIPHNSNTIPRDVDFARIRIACRIAATKPKQAVKLVEEIPADYGVQSRAYGRLAVAMAPHNKTLAWSLIDRALPIGPEMAGGLRKRNMEPEEAAELAVRARDIGFLDMQSAVWRVLACRPSTTEGFDNGAGSTVNMAVILALADPETARDILQTVERRIEQMGLRREPPVKRDDHWLAAWALADRKHAEELFQGELWKIVNNDPAYRDLRHNGFLPMVEVLATPPSERLRYFTGPLYYGRMEEDD